MVSCAIALEVELHFVEGVADLVERGLQGLSLSQSDREWLANKLIMPKDKETELSAEERKARFLRLAGIWSETEEGEEYYQMMKHRNDERPLNREINLDD